MSATHGGHLTGRTPQQPRHTSRLHRMNDESRSEMTRSLESSFMSLDNRGNVIPKTPAAAILAATTYLQVTQPPEGDPRAEQHRQAILGLGMAGAALGPRNPRGPTAIATPRKEESPRNREIAATRQGADASPRRYRSKEPRRHEETPPRRHRSRERRHRSKDL